MGFWELATLQVWRGIGMIVAVTATQSLAMGGVNAVQASSATSLLYLSRNLGGAFGVALLSSTLVTGSRQAYADLSVLYRAGFAAHARPGSGAPAIDALNNAALVLGFDQCFALVAVYCWGGALLTLTLRRRIPAPLNVVVPTSGVSRP